MSDETTWPGLDAVVRLCVRLKAHNDWRRGLTDEQPNPQAIGEDIDEAIVTLIAMAGAIRTTLDDNLELADGNVCTLIELKRVAEKV